jgi:hypothetical protein
VFARSDCLFVVFCLADFGDRGLPPGHVSATFGKAFGTERIF